MNFDSVHNYYEKLVFKLITAEYRDCGLSDEQLIDMACVALNLLPPRYIRHDVDMSFYMTGSAHAEMQTLIENAVKLAYDKMQENRI